MDASLNLMQKTYKISQQWYDTVQHL